MKTKNKIIISSLMAIALAGGIAGGATYALFTNDTSTNIAISSATVNVGATITDLKLYSADATVVGNSEDLVPGGDQLGVHAGTYYYVEQTGNFANGGTANYNSGTLALNAMSPGDKVNATFSVTNNSNVNIQYRYVAECTSTVESSLKLFSGLKFKALGQEKTNVRKYYTDWSNWLSSEATVKTTPIEVAMPITLGNEYQNLSTSIKLSVEAVQGNVVTVNDSDEILVFKSADIEANTGNASGMNDVTLKAGGTDVQPQVKVVVPTGTENEVTKGTGSTNVTAADKLNLMVSEQENSNIQVAAGQEALNYEIKLTNQDGEEIKSTHTEIEVSIFVGEDKNIVAVYHDGNKVTSYNYEYGYVTFKTNSFSPFTVVFKAFDPELRVYDSNDKVSSSYTLEDFATAVNNGNTFAGKTIKLIGDVDLSGQEWTPIGVGTRATAYSGRYFAGTFDGCGYTIFNLSCGTPEAYDTTYSGKNIYGLFGAINGATIKNLNLSDVSIYSSSDTVGGIVAYCFGSCEITNCKVLSGTISGDETFGGILGRSYNNDSDSSNEIVKVDSCVNNATIIKTGSSKNVKASGIVGYAAAASGTDVATNDVYVTNCTNNGSVKIETSSNGYVSGVVNFGFSGGSKNNNEKFVFTNNTNGANLYLSDAVSHVHVKSINYIGTECSNGSSINCTSSGHKNTGTAYRKSIDDADYASILTKYVNPSNGSSVDREADADFIVLRIVGDERAMNLEEIALRIESGENFDNWTFTLRRDLNPENPVVLGTQANPFKGIINYNGYSMNNVTIFSGND